MSSSGFLRHQAGKWCPDRQTYMQANAQKHFFVVVFLQYLWKIVCWLLVEMCWWRRSMARDLTKIIFMKGIRSFLNSLLLDYSVVGRLEEQLLGFLELTNQSYVLGRILRKTTLKSVIFQGKGLDYRLRHSQFSAVRKLQHDDCHQQGKGRDL